MRIGSRFSIWGHIEPFRDDIVTIGDDVVLGSDSLIITHCPIRFYNGKPVEIVIGNNVYIGAKCIILPGVEIGDNVVLGAGSVVSRSIPANVIAAGNPCRVIRTLAKEESLRIRLMTRQAIVADGTEPKYEN
jgi:acetyltransferase-like isoleucine patch superfamily enzyme